jgi:hypothetical protein
VVSGCGLVLSLMLAVGRVAEAVCRAFVPLLLSAWEGTGLGVGSNGIRERDGLVVRKMPKGREWMGASCLAVGRAVGWTVA